MIPQKILLQIKYLGLCSEKKLYVTDNAPNKHDINITAAMFTLERFEARKLWNGRQMWSY